MKVNHADRSNWCLLRNTRLTQYPMTGQLFKNIQVKQALLCQYLNKPSMTADINKTYFRV